MKQNFKSFFKGKGFYFSLFLGVVAILGVGFISSDIITKNQNNSEELAKKDPQASLIEDELPDFSLAQNETETPTNDLTVPEKSNEDDGKENIEENTKKSGSNNEDDNSSKKDDNKTEATSEIDIAPVVSQSEQMKNLSFNEEKGLLWPLNGDVILPYSMDHSIYFKTLGQYKVNPAIIISGTEGTEIQCAYDGIITSIEENEETGTTLTMSVGNGYEIIYGNLKDIPWKSGDFVTEGSFLGNLSSPTKYYVEEGTNLYFKVMQDDTAVNPLLVLR